MSKLIPQFPHCDSRVLHAPNECQYCDRHPEWQELRKTWGISFTGHSYKNNKLAKDEYGDTLQPCPAEAARGMESINGWGGNVAMTEIEKEREKYYDGLGKLFGSLDTEDLPDSHVDTCGPEFPVSESGFIGEQPVRRVTLSGKPADPSYGGPAPQPIDPATGMHLDYWVLSKEERAKGFVRPVRVSYKHVGVRPQNPLRDLTPEEQRLYASCGYVKYEAYPKSETSSAVGRFWTEEQLNSGCGTITSMGNAIAETYARNPKWYSETFCCRCGVHCSVGENGEFEWLDGSKVGS